MKRSSVLFLFNISVLFVTLIIMTIADCRLVPFTPCGKVFNYFESETYEIFGAMKFKNDLSGEYHLAVNMSIAKDTRRNIQIVRRTPEHNIRNGDDIEYYVKFPFNHTFPLMTSIVFNNKTYCTGPGEKETDDHGVTELSAVDHLSTVINEGVREQKLPPRPTTAPQITIINVFLLYPAQKYEPSKGEEQQESVNI